MTGEGRRSSRSLRIIALALALLVTAPEALAQQAQALPERRIGFLSRGGPSTQSEHLLDAFRNRLRELGHVEGQNLLVEWRWVGADSQRLTEAAADLVRAKVDVILARGTPETRAAKKATGKIPVVMIGVGDPVGSGFVASLARPGTNITGLSFIFPELSVKQLDLFREALPGVERIAILWNPENPSHDAALRALQASAGRLRLQLRAHSARSAEDFDAVFARLARERERALLVLGEPKVFQHRARLADLAIASGTATMFNLSEHARAGALMAYGVNFAEVYRRAAEYVDRILAGADPAELPVEQPTKFELVVNLRTAKALEVAIPPSILLRADRVIE